ncbi:amidase [Rhodoligotrophos defluvii]|uniref:amidase n=1 Tax=Rhodoligotrophos defluvii TaxID=2561934 RepID=UPI0010C953B5|nr:amidase [Rhodoligotrophos defluvii]
MSIEAPSAQDLAALAKRFGLEPSDADLSAFEAFAGGLRVSYDWLDEQTEPQPPRFAGERLPGHAPRDAENPYNAWAWMSDIRGSASGPLAGIRIGVKDNIAVAGLPMRNGSRTLGNFVPTIDATVVTRILEAGGTIAGKTTCEDLCFSGGSHTSWPAPVRNPRKPGHAAGGSSSGSAAAIAAGDVRMCLGGDQGGSIRTPSSWCGTVGLKPTHGLVPYTGIFPVEPTLDHCGPMGRTTEDVARLLAVIAGPDGLDPRQHKTVVRDYISALNLPLHGLSVGVVRQGFGRPESDLATDETVRDALKVLQQNGAEVEEVSIPWHPDGFHVYTAIVLEGIAEMMLKGNAMGYGWQGYYSTEMLEAFAGHWRSRPDELPLAAKFVLLASEYMRDKYHGRHYAKAQNLRPAFRAAYDEALQRFDVLAMPTIPFRAPPLPETDCGPEATILHSFNMEGNTGPFDVTGHPAISVPCGAVDELPVGLMFVGKAFDEISVLRAAHHAESLARAGGR